MLCDLYLCQLLINQFYIFNKNSLIEYSFFRPFSYFIIPFWISIQMHEFSGFYVRIKLFILELISLGTYSFTSELSFSIFKNKSASSSVLNRAITVLLNPVSPSSGCEKSVQRHITHLGCSLLGFVSAKI